MTIWLISTELKVGLGGISTALVGFVESDAFAKEDLQILASHSNKKNKYICWIKTIIITIRKVRKGDVVWLHCGNWFSIFRKLTIAWCAKLCGAKILFHLHEPMDNPLKNKYYRFLIKIVDSTADGLIFITDWGEQIFRECIPNINSKVVTIANPYDHECNNYLSKPVKENSTSDSPIILSMARVEKGKGIADVIRTIPYLPENYRILIAGNGKFLSDVKRLATKLNVDQRVEFLGWVDYHKKHLLLEQADVFFLPSKLDSFGMGYLEAMSAGIPVVALNLQAIPYVVEHNVAGILCKSDAPEILARAVIDAYQQRKTFGLGGKSTVKSKFCPEILSNKLIKVIRGL